MNVLNKTYFSDENSILYLLDCLERIKYLAVDDYCIDYYFLFCDDINIKINTTCEKIVIEKNHFCYNAKIFDTKILRPKSLEAINIIEEAFRDNKTIAINTARALLPPYSYYNENGVGMANGHYIPLLGTSEKEVYFIDDPGMLERERLVEYKGNPNIYVIYKDDLINALKTFCEVVLIDTKIENIITYSDFGGIISKIVENYYFKSELNSGNFIGREAIIYIYNLTMSKKYYKLKEHLEKDYFFIYMMFASRVILKKCLINYKKYVFINSSKTYFEYLDKTLDLSINKWENFRNLLIRHAISPIIELDKKINNQLTDIIKVDDLLFEYLNKLEL